MADAIEAEDLDVEIPAGDIKDQEADQLQAGTPEGEDGEEDEVLVSFDGEEGSPPSGDAQDSSVIRKLREEVRKTKAELQAFRAQVPQTQMVEVGEKPTLAGCDYDEERYEAELLAHQQRKAQADQAQADARKAEEQRQAAWEQKLAAVATQKSQLAAKDYDHAEEVVKADLNDVQQAMIVRATTNAAQMIYALGKNPQKRAEFAKIADPVEAIAWLVRTEGKLTVSSRKAPQPEQIARGSAPLSNASDKHLERLEAEAARTGDRTKVVQYKREQRAKARS